MAEKYQQCELMRYAGFGCRRSCYPLSALAGGAGAPTIVDPRDFAAMFEDVYVDTVYSDAIMSDAQGETGFSAHFQTIPQLVQHPPPPPLQSHPKFLPTPHQTMRRQSHLRRQSPSWLREI